ncbi:lectin subunit alpha [Musca domestica]|uniref:Lectin subunit alpha n=1 Tax=Musca domestica TaxID=7370 RepID=A0A1I8NCE1_MUSDO|nr:lectin subunit alpha [Musca domestica]
MKCIAILVLLTPLVTGAVIKKWHKSDDGSLYYVENEQKFNWFEALHECARKNMSLIAIDRYDRHFQIDTLIRSLFPTSPPFWIAGHDMAVDTRYQWATTGEIFTFTNWGQGQPGRSNNNEHCILIWTTWDWHDLPCTSSKLGFICEENRLLKAKSREQDQDDLRALAKTFIWKNYNGNCN